MSNTRVGVRTGSTSDRERVVVAMSILKYFKPKDGLPHPKGSLSQRLHERLLHSVHASFLVLGHTPAPFL